MNHSEYILAQVCRFDLNKDVKGYREFEMGSKNNTYHRPKNKKVAKYERYTSTDLTFARLKFKQY